MTSRHFSKAALLVAAASLLSGCAAEIITPPAVTTTVTPTEDRIVVPSPPADPIPEVAWPLTGLDAIGATQEEIDRIAIAVKIDNHPHARPPKNLEQADIVFEEYVEFGISRLIAVFHSSHPDEVGPIRSLRPMDPNIVGSLYSPLVFSGAAPAVIWDAQKTDQVLIYDDGGDDGFFRVRIRNAPHNLHGDVNVFAEQAAEEGLPAAAPQFNYAYPAELATAATTGTPVSEIDIKFSVDAHPTWVWDDASGLWMRSEEGEPHLSVDDVQIATTNIVILRVTVQYVFGYIPKSNMIVESAPGYIATDGKVTEIRWSKSDRRDGYHLTTLDGEAVTLAPGQTWVELVPISGAKHRAVIKFDDVEQSQ